MYLLEKMGKSLYSQRGDPVVNENICEIRQTLKFMNKGLITKYSVFPAGRR